MAWAPGRVLSALAMRDTKRPDKSRSGACCGNMARRTPPCRFLARRHRRGARAMLYGHTRPCRRDHRTTRMGTRHASPWPGRAGTVLPISPQVSTALPTDDATRRAARRPCPRLLRRARCPGRRQTSAPQALDNPTMAFGKRYPAKSSMEERNSTRWTLIRQEQIN